MKSQFFKIFTVFILAFSCHIQSMFQTPRQQAIGKGLLERGNRLPQQPQTHGLLIFLDTTESKNILGPVTSTLIPAIYSKAGPIIITASLMKAVYTSSNYDQTSLAEIYKQPMSKKLFDDIRIFSMGLNKQTAKEWIIKGIDDGMNPSFYLLIPKSYLKEKNINSEDVEVFSDEKRLTLTELKLGLKVNHMYPMSPELIEQSSVGSKSFLDTIWDEKQKSSAIFVTNEEYKNSPSFPVINPPLWAFFINGHGGLKTKIVGLSLDDFQHFLTFIERKIKTKLLYYSSCYAAGLNSKILYAESERMIARTYPFTIITQALTDAAVMSFGALIIKVHPNGTVVASGLGMERYNKFFKEVENKDYIDYRAIVTALSQLSVVGFTEGGLAQIKLPGVEWFSVMDTEAAISIGNVLAQHRKKPLDTNYFKLSPSGRLTDPNPGVILLYTQDIPFELIISSIRMPAIVSMIPGDAEHHFQKISSKRSHSLNLMMRKFLTLKYLVPTKIFKIDELVGENDNEMKKLLGTNDQWITLKNVTITLWFDQENEKDRHSISFTYDDKPYVIEYEDTIRGRIKKIE